MRRRALLLTSLVLLAPLGLASNCRKKPVEAPPPPPAPAPAAPAPAAEAPREVTESFPTQPVEAAPIVEPTIDELNRRGVLRTVYYAYDRSDLDEAARATLQANAAWLRSNPTRSIVIEGHCDERGTVEYNLALGERRADAARQYLSGLGVDASRIRIVSYGKERPVDPGHDDTAWSRNRRAEFAVES